MSVGFAAAARDPFAREMLEVKVFRRLGGSIRKLGIPTISLLAGWLHRRPAGTDTGLPEGPGRDVMNPKGKTWAIERFVLNFLPAIEWRSA